MRKIASILSICILFHYSIKAQTTYLIPGNTGYAVPVELDEESLFQEGKGLTNWTDLNQDIQYFFHIPQTGKLNIAINLKNAQVGSFVSIEIANKTFRLAIPQSNDFQKKIIGLKIFCIMELNRALQQLKECKEYVYNSLCDSGAPDGRLIRAVGRLHGCDATLLVEIVKYLIKYDATQKPNHEEVQQVQEPIQKVQKPIEQVPAKIVPEKSLQSVDWSLAQTLLEDL